MNDSGLVLSDTGFDYTEPVSLAPIPLSPIDDLDYSEDSEQVVKFQRDEVQQEINPFMDLTNPLPEGQLSLAGGSLNRIYVPEIKTLIPGINIVPTELKLVPEGENEITDFSNRANSTIQGGIQIDIGMYGASAPKMVGEINAAEIGGKGTDKVPSTWLEARDALPKISGGRKGDRNEVYGVNIIRQIAKNLGLPSGGRKSTVADRIRMEVMKHFNMQ